MLTFFRLAARSSPGTRVRYTFHNDLNLLLVTDLSLAGHDLLNPYCADRSGWTPTDNSLIAAVTISWGSAAGGRPPCGSFLQLKAPAVNKAVIVRVSSALSPSCLSTRSDLSLTTFSLQFFSLPLQVVDMCGGCVANVPHVDLSLRAFSALYSLDVGKVADIQVSYVSQPFGDWNSDMIATYGPQNL